ncbi:hypothetical protein [Actinomadura sp. SCN-SB]|uniref:hypothetical protein n=1 Tax=Actinomadura sp. SCN-SB TaxID=3373092 RepID=UPI0037520989
METAPFLIWYDAEIIAQYVRIGNPIYRDDIYATVIQIIRDEARRRVIIQARGDDDGRDHVFEIPYDTGVEAGVITQYGIERPERGDIMPVHPSHGPRAHELALRYIRTRGGRLMTRHVIPDTATDLGVMPLDEFAAAR